MRKQVTSVEYKPNKQIRYLSQRHKDGSRPHADDKVLGGSNGTFPMLTSKGMADVLVHVATADGDVPIPIGPQIRAILGTSRLSRKLYADILSRQPHEVEVEYIDGKALRISYESLRSWILP